LKQVAVIL